MRKRSPSWTSLRSMGNQRNRFRYILKRSIIRFLLAWEKKQRRGLFAAAICMWIMICMFRWSGMMTSGGVENVPSDLDSTPEDLLGLQGGIAKESQQTTLAEARAATTVGDGESFMMNMLHSNTNKGRQKVNLALQYSNSTRSMVFNSLNMEEENEEERRVSEAEEQEVEKIRETEMRVQREQDQQVEDGVLSAVVRTFIIDSPRALSNNPKPVIRFSADREVREYVVSLDGGAWIFAQSPLRFRHSLSEGQHSIRVAAVDLRGNRDPNPAEASWRVDLTPPRVFLDSFPSNPSNVVPAPFTVRTSERGCALLYSLDVPLGHSRAASQEIVEEEVASLENNTKSTKSGKRKWVAAEVEGFVSVQTLSNTTARILVPNITDGVYRLRVAARDKAGNLARPKLIVWTVDLTPPETRLISGPPKTITSRSVVLMLRAPGEESGSYTYQYRLNHLPDIPGGDPFLRSSPQIPEGDPPEDQALPTEEDEEKAVENSIHSNNSSFVSATTTGASMASDDTVSSSQASHVHLSRTAAEVHKRRLWGRRGWVTGNKWSSDGAALTLSGNTLGVNNLKEGPHQVEIRAVDSAGNPDPSPVVVRWSVHQSAPKISVSMAPSHLTCETNATFRVGCTHSQYMIDYKLDKNPWVFPAGKHLIRGSLFFIVPNLALGDHSIQLRTTDATGMKEVQPVTIKWKIGVCWNGPPA